MGFTAVTVTGTYKNSDGTPAAGFVTFQATAEMANGDIRPAELIRGNLVTGALSVSLPATNDPGTVPTGVTYTVIEQITGASTRVFQLAVPYTSTTLDLSTVAPALPTTPLYGYALDTQVMHLAGNETLTGVKASSTWKFSGPVPWADVLHPTYGGNDNGVADNATAIQAAINALSAIGGGVVKCSFLTSGIYAFATAITLKTGVVLELDPNVTLKWTGAAGGTMFTTSTVTPVQKSGIVCKGGFGIIDPGGTTNGADIIFDLHSVQLCEFGNLQGLSARSTSIAFKLQADCSVITNSDLKTNCGLNTFHDIEWTGRIGIGIQKSGLAVSNNGDGNPSVITLNEFRNFAFRDIQNIGVNVVQWADDDMHTGVHTYKLNADNAIGIVLNNSVTPAANVGVYCQQWQYVAIPFFGAFTGRQGIIFNYTKLNVIRNYFEDPSAGASAVVDNNSLSHFIERIGVPNVNNLVNYSKNFFLLDESATATGPTSQYMKWRPNQADTQNNDELMNLAGYLWQTGAQIGPVAGWKYVQQVVTAGALQGQMRFMAAHGASAYAGRIYMNTDGRIGTGGNAQVNAGVQAVPPAAGTTALRAQQAAGQTNPLIDTYASNGSTQLPFTVDASGVLTTPTISTPLVTGTGQTSASVDTTTSLASALRLLDTGSSAGNGGMVLFGAGAGYWAAMKGLEVNNANNTTGDLVISIRNAATDATLTERWRLSAAGVMTLNSAGASIQHNPTGGVTRGAQNSAQVGYPIVFPAVGTVVAETPLLTINGPTHTITGGFATQRFNQIAQPTITAGSALTVTDAATLAIAGAPIAAGSAVITRKHQLWLQGTDKMRIDTTTQTTIGANGAASALTALPVGYLPIYVGTAIQIIPYYNP